MPRPQEALATWTEGSSCVWFLFLQVDLADAVAGTVNDEVAGREATGGIIAVSADGSIVIAHNSPAMFAAYRAGDELVTLT